MNTITCGFLGLGLIGGSIAKALKASDLSIYTIAYDVDEKTLQDAHQDHVIDEICYTVDASFQNCDFIFLCAPIEYNINNLSSIRSFLKPSCILTDVSSVKTEIHHHMDVLGLTSQFIGGHPMAGSERYGYQNSKTRLLENAYYIITPTKLSTLAQIDTYSSLIKKMGAIPLVLDYEKHDYITAAISHLPHILASSLVNFVKDADSEDGSMKMIAAGGFKDITRIASSSPVLWKQICLSNSVPISSLLDSYIHSLKAVQEMITTRAEDSLTNFFSDARQYRDSFIDSSSGPIKKTYIITVDIPDRTGALSSIVSILAEHQIGIKNIGITHNREYEEGSLRLELFDEVSLEEARLLLNETNFHVHQI